MSLASGEYRVFKAKAVILATGGLGALYKLTTNSAVLTGDGFALAFEAGAELVDMEMVQFFPIAFPYPAVRRGKMICVCSWFGPDVKLLNGLGERYMPKYDPERKEMSTRDNVSRANFLEIMEGRGTKNGAIVVDQDGITRALDEAWATFSCGRPTGSYKILRPSEIAAVVTRLLRPEQ